MRSDGAISVIINRHFADYITLFCGFCGVKSKVPPLFGKGENKWGKQKIELSIAD